MAGGSSRRPTRSSARGKSTEENERKKAESTSVLISVTPTDKESSDVPRSQICDSVSENSNVGKKNKQPGSRKRGKRLEDDTEKENVKHSRGDASASSRPLVKAEVKSRLDGNNNDGVEAEENTSQDTKSKYFPAKKTKVNAKSNPPSRDAVSLPTSSFVSPKQPEHGQIQNPYRPSQLDSCSPMRSRNIYHQYVNSFIGKPWHRVSEPASNIIAKDLSDYEVASNDHPFQCRITSIEWHPRKRNFIGVGSKHGDLTFYKIKHEDFSQLEVVQTFSGIGPGGNVPSLKFHPSLDDQFYTSSLCGKVTLRDVEGLTNRILLDTMSWENWYSCLDVNTCDCVVAAGRNKGGAALLDKDGKQIWDKRLHRQKISHLEFSPRDSHLFCTASLDYTVKIWDLRKVEEKSPLDTLVHEKGLNSACFSLTDGCRLLTTDQYQDIRVYSSPSWNLERIIPHPHRFFQHITPIKACWHPLQDMILCGRYPNIETLPEYRPQRSIDMLDAATGERLGELYDPHFNGITSLVKMNNEGNKLVSAMGYNLNLWNSEDKTAKDAYSAWMMKRPLEESRVHKPSRTASLKPPNKKSSSSHQNKKNEKTRERKKEFPKKKV